MNDSGRTKVTRRHIPRSGRLGCGGGDHCAAACAGRTEVCAAQREGQRRRWSAPAARGGRICEPVQGSRRAGDRRGRSDRSISLDAFYYKGLGGRKPVQAEIEKHYAAADAQLPLRRVRGLPRDAGEGEGDRRHPVRHARPSARLRVDPGHAGGQARLLREAADAQYLGGPAGGQGGQGDGRGHADGQSRPFRATASAQTCEWIWDGAIGPVREVHAWVGATAGTRS